jgi:hypothetical protein
LNQDGKLFDSVSFTGGNVSDYTIYLEEDIDVDVQVPEWGDVCGNVTYENGTNEICNTEITGYHTETETQTRDTKYDGDVLPAQGDNQVLGNILVDPWEKLWK